MSHTIASAAADLRQGRLTSVALVEASLDAIDRHQERTNAFITIDADGALSAARLADHERGQGLDRGPLHGVPISLKDLIDVRGQMTTAASRVLDDRLVAADATVVTRLRQAGAVVIGRTNLHEFALGTTSEDSAFGAVHHQMDPTRSAGGSSGGSAVAVALGMGVASVGTDTGGSIRIPAAACGVVGLKPSSGEVPADGVVPLSTSLDHVGPITRTVEDAAILYGVLTGTAVTPLRAAALGELRLCWLAGYFDAPIEPAVRQAFEEAQLRLQSAGVDFEIGEIPDAIRTSEVYVDIVLPEAARWHAAYLETRPDRYTPAVRARLESGRQISVARYEAAIAARVDLAAAVDAALDGVDALILPTLPIVAPPLGVPEIEVDPSTHAVLPVRTAMLKHTQLFNITKHPAISLPIATAGLPVGLQLVGRIGQTPRLLAIAAACEKIVSTLSAQGPTPGAKTL